MGNYISCTLAPPLMNNAAKAAPRVIFPGGEVRRLGLSSVKAAELMLECPNFFLTNAQSLHIGRRFSALGADEELELGNVYIMFPMKRVNAVVTAADMATSFMAANSASKRMSGGNNWVGVSPDSGEDHMQESKFNDHVVDRRMEDGVEGVGGREMFNSKLCRSRKPMLETIIEEPVRSR